MSRLVAVGSLGSLNSWLSGNLLEVVLLVVGIGILFAAFGGNHRKAMVMASIVLVGLAVVGLGLTGGGLAIGRWLATQLAS